MNYSDHFESFWQRYGQDESMSVTAKGSKFKAYESWDKIGKKWASREHREYNETEFAQTVWRGYEAQKANRRAMRSTKAFVPPLPMVTTYLNQFRFETEFDKPTGEMRRQAQHANAQACDSPGCGEQVIGRSEKGGWICKTHDLKLWWDLNRDAFKERHRANPRQPGESWREWSWRLMQTSDIGSALLAKMRARNPVLKLDMEARELKLREAHAKRIDRLNEELRGIREKAAQEKAEQAAAVTE